ncbi:hypothetical protein L596_014047 [Steinernema carpocapsae]|uniref:Uncharacterized protein n=1 Tax=Steinernema carpocapsae TaxID=34508 RepID=A0A4U5NBP7_STECR|nr:hypothetical protein L596_014047 [Steinernema carpocapsae]
MSEFVLRNCKVALTPAVRLQGNGFDAEPNALYKNGQWLLGYNHFANQENVNKRCFREISQIGKRNAREPFDVYCLQMGLRWKILACLHA